jgi:3-hydroxyisobutyrate dehydrogenase-like beta-hydroxyacid dehydrogenase
MGSAMARRFHAAGYGLVVWNRDVSKSAALEAELGAVVAATPAAAAGAATMVVTSLADDAALRAIYLGADGIVHGVRPGTVAIDTSTVDPSSAVEVGRAITVSGGAFLDCPVSGSVSTVESGSLLVMAGGDTETLGSVEPLLSTIARRVIHMGPSGSGAACKLAVNGFVHGLNVALAEALVLAEKAGLDRSKAYEVFAGGAGGAPFVQYKREAYLHPDSTPIGFTLDLVAKDLDLITGLAARVGATMHQAEACRALVGEAVAAGLGSADMSAIATFLRGDI